jgi:hypothetical protein
LTCRAHESQESQVGDVPDDAPSWTNSDVTVRHHCPCSPGGVRSRRASIPGTAGGFNALLQKPGLVHDEYAIVGSQVFGPIAAQVVADRVGVPLVVV